MSNNKSAIAMSALAGVGVIASAFAAAMATPKAYARSVERCGLTPSDFIGASKTEKIEIVKAVLPEYALAIGCVCGTVACIFAANHMSRRSQASLASAYAALEKSYREYREQSRRLLGGDDEAIRKMVAVKRYPKGDLAPGPGELLFYDYFTGEYFESTILSVIDAEYQLNRKLSVDGIARLSDYCQYAGIDCGDWATDVGWLPENRISWIDFEHELVVMPDGLECYIISMSVEPSAL